MNQQGLEHRVCFLRVRRPSRPVRRVPVPDPGPSSCAGSPPDRRGARGGGASADHIPAALTFDVASSTFFESGETPNVRYPLVMADHKWGYTPAWIL